MIARILTLSQIQYFCSIAGHEYFTEVPDSFIEDQFNLTGLHGQVPFYQEAMSMILDGGYGTEPSLSHERKGNWRVKHLIISLRNLQSIFRRFADNC